jgi:hypothetical protein
VRPASGIPCALHVWRDTLDASPGHFVPRECEGVLLGQNCTPAITNPTAGVATKYLIHIIFFQSGSTNFDTVKISLDRGGACLYLSFQRKD